VKDFLKEHLEFSRRDKNHKNSSNFQEGQNIIRTNFPGIKNTSKKCYAILSKNRS